MSDNPDNDLLDDPNDQTTEQPEQEKAPEPEPEPKPEPEAKKPEDMVPASVLARERQELRARAEYWEGIAKQAQQPKGEDKPNYDFIADPDALPRYVQEQMQRAKAEVRADMSFTFAVDRHGQDTVNASIEAAKGNQALIAAANASPDPYGHLVKAHKQQMLMAEVGDDPAAYERKVREKIMAEMRAQATVDQAKGRTPPASLAGDANLGARGDVSQEADLDAVIGRGG